MSSYEVAAYYFPQYHADPRNDRWHGPGWTEWQVLQQATPRFPGHRQPIVPAWGYFDESDPAWAARQIDVAADHGITSFLFDWYWYQGEPFLQRALEQGFLGAPNRTRLRFALMWANHDWINLYPARYTNAVEMLATGQMASAAFAQMNEYIIEHYFTQPNYLMIDDAPLFTLYDLGNFIAGVGGIIAARTALNHFRARARQQGFRDIHLNAIQWGMQMLPGESALIDPEEVIAELGFASIGSYVWMHHVDLLAYGFPECRYDTVAAASFQTWQEHAARYAVPYFPNVTMGWDSSPRTAQSDNFAPGSYPWLSVLTGNTPAAFQRALEAARAYADQHLTAPKLITINAWNEWTEGSYLLPDTTHGTAYLEAIRRVFPPAPRAPAPVDVLLTKPVDD